MSEPYGFDVDGVLADFPSAYQRLTVRCAGEDRFHPGDAEDPPCWHWPQFRGYSEELMDFDAGPVWREIRSGGAFWRGLGALPGAAALASCGALAGRDVYFVTNRPGLAAKRQTEQWLREHVGIESPTVLVSAEKGACARALGLCAYIDDHLPNVLDVAAKSPATRAYLLDRRHNCDGRQDGYVRVASVDQMLRLEGLL